MQGPHDQHSYFPPVVGSYNVCMHILHRYDEVAKRSTDMVKSPTIRRHCVTIGSGLPCYTLVSLHSFVDLLHYYYITYIAYKCNIILGT